MDRNAWDERYAGDELVWSAQPNRFLVAEVETLPPGRALDLACGEGRNAVWLAERGWDVTGVDFSNVGLDKARRLAEARGVSAQWEVADVTEYTPAPESFDLVIVMYLHLPEASRRLAFRHAAGCGRDRRNASRRRSRHHEPERWLGRAVRCGRVVRAGRRRRRPGRARAGQSRTSPTPGAHGRRREDRDRRARARNASAKRRS